jgi:hypothetical protein
MVKWTSTSRKEILAELRNGTVPSRVQKNYTEIPDEQTKRTEREKNIHTVRPAGLKTRRSFSYTIITKNSCF